jgi:hypothetical protein
MTEAVFPPEGGACKGKPVEWWFPLKLASMNKAQVAGLRASTIEAIKICNGCAIKDPCLDYSLEWEALGIWGGYDEGERHHIRKERKLNLMRDNRVLFGGRTLRQIRREAEQQKKMMQAND